MKRLGGPEIEDWLNRIVKTQENAYPIIEIYWDDQFAKTRIDLSSRWSSALNSVATTEIALSYFRSLQKAADGLEERYLHLYGAFSAANVQQDGLLALYNLCSGNKKSYSTPAGSAWQQIREFRRALLHPTNFKRGKGFQEYVGLGTIAINPGDYGMALMVSGGNDRSDRVAHSSKDARVFYPDVPQLFSDYRRDVLDCLFQAHGNLVKFIDQRRRSKKWR